MVLISLSIIIAVIIMILLLAPGSRKDQTTSSSSKVAETESLHISSEPVDTLALFMKIVDDSIAQAPEWNLRVNAIGECWMNLDSDGRRLFSAMVFENMNLEFKAKNSFTIYSGKNQGLKIWLNGFELKPLPSGVTNLNRENFKELVSTDEVSLRIKNRTK